MEGRWIGIIDGTNKGQILLDLQEKAGKIQGTIFVHDIKLPTLIAKVELQLKDNKLSGKIYDFKPYSKGMSKTANINAEVLEQGLEIKGKWQTELGATGELHLFKIKEGAVNPLPTAFISKPINLPAFKLDAKELKGLLKLMTKGIDSTVLPTFTVNHKGSSFIRLGIDAFIEDDTMPRVINDITISVNEPAVGKGYRIINANLKPSGDNNVSVSGNDPTWVNGRASEIENYIIGYKNRSNIIFSKIGPFINSIIFLIILILLPSITNIPARGLLMTITVSILIGLNKIYKNRFPKTVIYLGKKSKTFWEENRSNIFLSFITIILDSAIIGLATFFINHWDKIISWFSSK